MRLAISNIAWPSGRDEAVAPILRDHGAEGVEIAPTKVWPKPLEARASDLVAYRRFWERRDLRVVALQALLFGRPDLTLFDGDATRRRTVEYLKGMIAIAAALGAECLVFGSPTNRKAGTRQQAEVEAIAIDVFRELGHFAAERNVCFCVEPNPKAYNCDFVTDATAGAELVERVGHGGFGLHLDTGAMTLAGDAFDLTFRRANGSWRHFHVSEPYLAPVGEGGVNHHAIADAMIAEKYSRWVSIEMKEITSEDAWMQTVHNALAYVNDVYFASPA
jgi:sugar phosphate isomerase/epimerase